MTDLTESTVLITGAARGLGRQMARQAVDLNARVVAWDLDGEALEDLAADLGPSLVSKAVVDVTDRDSIQAGVDALDAGPGQVDVVINNAGVVSGARLVDLKPEQIERTFAVNVLALYWVTQAFLPAMLERDRGHVVTLASAAGLVGVAKQTDYAASKHAAVGFMESLRAEMRRDGHNVATTTVCPFYVDTGMFDGAKSKVPWLLPIQKEAEVAGKILQPRGIRTDLQSGELLTISSSDADNASYLLDYIPRIVASLTATTVCAISLLLINVPLGLAVVLGTPLVLLFLQLTAPLITHRIQLQQETAGQAASVATDLVSGLRPLRRDVGHRRRVRTSGSRHAISSTVTNNLS
jgi:all-trans-retinol dehydrogenase (NAD+)